jgi:hypothetical protein
MKRRPVNRPAAPAYPDRRGARGLASSLLALGGIALSCAPLVGCGNMRPPEAHGAHGEHACAGDVAAPDPEAAPPPEPEPQEQPNLGPGVRMAGAPPHPSMSSDGEEGEPAAVPEPIEGDVPAVDGDMPDIDGDVVAPEPDPPPDAASEPCDLEDEPIPGGMPAPAPPATEPAPEGSSDS